MAFKEKINQKWRNRLFRLSIVLAVIFTVAEIIVYNCTPFPSSLPIALNLYRIRFIYVPTALFSAAIAPAGYLLYSRSLTNRMKNMCISILLYFICACVQMIYCMFAPLLVLPAIAVILSVFFGDPILTIGITAASAASAMLSSHLAAQEFKAKNPMLLGETLSALLVVIAIGAVALLLIKCLSEQTEYIISSNLRQKRLKDEFDLDPLMGINNRRSLNEQLPAIAKHPHNNSPMHLLMLDLDNFKDINDTYGHPCGDEVLLELVRVLRSSDENERISIYRYGGEEVVMLLRNMERNEAYYLCDELRERFSLSRFSFAPSIRVTFSGGFASYHSGLCPNEWLQTADKLLYRAKAAGKNKIVK